MTKFLNNADIKGYIAQTAVTSYLIKADSTGRLVAAIAGTDYQAPTTALLPTGGTAGQILSKIDGTNYNTQWIDNFAQQLKHDVKLGATIAKGKAVYVSSANGTNMIVSAASNASEATSSKTLGLLETGGVTNDIVKVVTEGLLAGLDTSAATAGDPVWLGTSGNLIFGLANKPVAPAHMVFIGIVTRSQSVNGEIFVKVQNGFELDELHNVGLSSVADGQGLFYESATSLWKNKTIAAVLGYTPANDSAVVHLAGTETITGVKTFSSVINASTLSLNGGTLAGNNIVSMRSNPTGGQFRIEKSDGSLSAYPFYIGVDGTALAYYYNASGALKVLLHTDGTSYFGNSLSVGYSTYAATSYSLDVNGSAQITSTLQVGGNLYGVGATFSNAVTAASIIKSGGTSSQFLKADGSVDSSSYITASSLSSYLALTGGTLTGDLTLSGTNPRLYFTDTDNNPDYFISNTDGTFTVYDVTNSVGRFKIYSGGNFELNGLVSIGASSGNGKLSVYGGEIGTQITFTKDAPSGAYGRLGQDSNGTFLTQNAKWDGTSWTRDNTGGVPMALALHNGNGRYEFRIAANGANPISWTNALVIESNAAATFSSSIAATNITLGSGTIGSIPSWMKVITTGTESALGAVYNNKAIYVYNNGSALKIDAYDYATSTALDIQVGGNGGKIILSNGQVRFTTYTSATSFTGTAAGYLAFDSSGNVITVAGVAATDDTKLPLAGGQMTGQFKSSSTAPIQFNGNSNTGTYNNTTIYANQNNTSGDTANGIFIERGRLTDSASAEVRQFVIGARGGQIQWRLDGSGNSVQTGNATAAIVYANTHLVTPLIYSGGGSTSFGNSVTFTSVYSGSGSDYTGISNPAYKVEVASGYWRIVYKSAHASNSGVYNYETGKSVFWGEPSDTGDYQFRGRTLKWVNSSGTEYGVYHAGNLTNLNQLTNGPGYITSSATITGAAARISSRDNRTISPSEDNASELRFGFTSWANNDSAPYADYLHLRSYSDNSGGSDNLVMFLKSGIGMRIWQQSFGSASAFSSYVDVLHSGNYNSYALPLNGNWVGNTGMNDQKLYLRTNGDNNHYLWNAADDWEELNAYEGTGFRITSVGGTVGVLYVYGSTNGGYTYSPYSFRAPIFYDSNDTTYYGDFAATGTALRLGGNIFANGSFGTNGYGSGAVVGRVFAPKGATFSLSAYANITGAIKIRLPQRANDTMWSMKVRIYNYSTNDTSEYLLGNYSYSAGGYNYSASYLGGSSSSARNVRFGNEGGYDCVWIGETSTGWTHPVVSVMDFMGGYANGSCENWDDNWDINIVSSFGTIAATVSPAIRFGDVYSSSINSSNVYASSDVRGNDVYTTGGWFRNHTNNNGIYWSNTGWHIYPYGSGDMYIRSGSASEVALRFITSDAVDRGFFYANNSNEVGILTNDRNWALRINSSKTAYFHGGSVYIGWGQGSSNIFMYDSDETTRRIHCNSNRIGFLNSSDGWGSWCDNDGGWQSAASISAGGSMYSPNWFRSTGNTGWYNDTYGQGLRQSKANVSYGNVIVHGENYNGWSGYNTNLNYITCFMQNSSGTHGWYQENGAGWTAFYNYGYACWGLGTDATDPSYSLHITKYGGSNTGWIIWSDRRIKENIKTIDNALDKVLALRGVYYNKIDDPTKTRQVGYIAQEVMEVVPELVVYSEELDIYNMNYAPMVGMLTEAIKEQQSQIETLKTQVQTLLTHINNGIQN